MFHRIIFVFLVIVCCVGCIKESQVDGYTKDSTGFYYKLLAIGDGNEQPQRNNILLLEAQMKTLSDSVFWDTNHDATNGLYIDLNDQLLLGSCNPYFLQMVEGDSASFLIKPSIFFKNYFDTIVPDFCRKDTLLKLNVKLIQIMSKAEYNELKKFAECGNNEEDFELQELQSIDDYLRQYYKHVKVDGNGIYTLKKTLTNSESLAFGKRVKVAYQGCFLDGKPIDISEQTIEYVYGTPDQLIKGLNIVIGSLKKGETTKIIVPSRLAFGELGSSNGSVPPYTPLVYNIKIIDIK